MQGICWQYGTRCLLWAASRSLNASNHTFLGDHGGLPIPGSGIDIVATFWVSSTVGIKPCMPLLMDVLRMTIPFSLVFDSAFIFYNLAGPYWDERSLGCSLRSSLAFDTLHASRWKSLLSSTTRAQAWQHTRKSVVSPLVFEAVLITAIARSSSVGIVSAPSIGMCNGISAAQCFFMPEVQ